MIISQAPVPVEIEGAAILALKSSVLGISKVPSQSLQAAPYLSPPHPPIAQACQPKPGDFVFPISSKLHICQALGPKKKQRNYIDYRWK